MSVAAGLLLDTPILLHIRRATVDPAVGDFLHGRRQLRFYVSALSLGQLRHARPDDDGWLADLRARFARHILPVDDAVAMAWVPPSTGSEVTVVRSLMAATAARHRLTVVSDDVAPYRQLGVSAISPWG